MEIKKFTIEDLWEQVDFEPNPEQKQAIKHVNGPLFLAAGPGSGKTRVLLWRTLNLIVFHDVSPEEIFLSTFTEKAAFQLREGIRSLLAIVTNQTNQSFDIGRMFVGTAHSLCRRIILDRRFSIDGNRNIVPVLLDDLGQYFFLSGSQTWNYLLESAGFEDEEANQEINRFFDGGNGSLSKHKAVTNTRALFNRLSEECVDPALFLSEENNDLIFNRLLTMYKHYLHNLENGSVIPKTDFALLQQAALETLESCETSGDVFQHIIIDEYQDTNTIQERLFFKLAQGQKNICVVGDDDQALYRFRGATVENFVDFPERSRSNFQLEENAVRRITLSTNYRSLENIVDFYKEFIETCDWCHKENPERQYRVHDKNLQADRKSSTTAVVASMPGHPDDVCEEIASLVHALIKEGKVEDPSQIAFLYPSLKSKQVGRMRDALGKHGYSVYAPRAGRFLEVDEAVDIFGVFSHIFGKPEKGDYSGTDYNEFFSWIDHIHKRGKDLLKSDKHLKDYVRDRKAEIQTAIGDYSTLLKILELNHWDLTQVYDIGLMKRKLHGAPGLSDKVRKSLSSARFERIVKKRIESGSPYDLRYILLRATSLDWSVLELFYQLCGFENFKHMYDLAEKGKDEGPICNLSLISQYLARFMDEFRAVITAPSLVEDKFQRLLFVVFLYAIFRLGESEYEDADDPFPKGRIPFLTIHQAKGLEFPIVVLGNPRKRNNGPQPVECLVRPLLVREGEPLDRLAEFDIMRMFYVALSRAQNLLVIPHWKSQGNYISQPFREMLNDEFPRIPNYNISRVPSARLAERDLMRNFSFTGDYLLYKRCPREYMVFRKYGFAPSTTQTYAFGRLVHQTLEDLHLFLISKREEEA